MTTMNIRIEEGIKKKASKVFSKMGLTTSAAINMFLNQSIKEDGLPFTPTNNTKAIRARWDKELADTMKNGKSYKSAKELMNDILK